MIVTREEGARPIKAWLGTKEIVTGGTIGPAGIVEHRETVIDVEDAALQQTKNIARLRTRHALHLARKLSVKLWCIRATTTML